MKKSRLLAVILVAVLTFGLLGCSEQSAAEETETQSEQQEGEASNEDEDGKDIRIALVSPTQHYDFFVYLSAAAKRKAEELGVELDVFDGQADFPEIAEYISHCVVQGYDAICTGGYQDIIPAAMEANEAGIPMVNFDARLDSDKVEFAARVASDNGAIGEAAAQFIMDDIDNRDDKDNYVVYYINYMSSESNTQRCDGFVKAFDGVENVELREIIPKDGEVEASQTLIDDLLVSNPKGSIDYIFGSSAGMGVGALASVTTANREEIGIISVDDEEGLLDALQEDGPFLATVAQDSVAIGEQTVEAALKAVNGEDSGDIAVSVTLVTKDNVDEYIESQNEQREALEPYK